MLKTQVLPRRRGNGNWREAILEGGENHHHLPPTSSHQNSQPKRTASSSPKQRSGRRNASRWLRLVVERAALSALCLLWQENGEGDLRFPQQVEERFGWVSGKNAAGKGIGRCRRASLSCRTIFGKKWWKRELSKLSLFSSKESPKMLKI